MAKAIYIMLDMGLMDYRILSIRNDGLSVQPGKHLGALRERIGEDDLRKALEAEAPQPPSQIQRSTDRNAQQQ